jgi:hypothetical protein
MIKLTHRCNISKAGNSAVAVDKCRGNDKVIESTIYHKRRVGILAWMKRVEVLFCDVGSYASQLSDISASEHQMRNQKSHLKNGSIGRDVRELDATNIRVLSELRNEIGIHVDSATGTRI